MRLNTPTSGEIDADFAISEIAEDGSFDVTIESAGGSTTGGYLRNPGYTTLLEELLRRIADLSGTLVDAFVDSQRVAALPKAQRRIHIAGHPYPFSPSPHDDFVSMRKGLTRPQSDIGSTGQATGGNRRKRITITVRVSPSMDRAALLKSLVDRIDPRNKPGIALGLTRADIWAAIQRWRVVGRDEFLADLKAAPTHRYVLLEEGDTLDALAVLLGARAMARLTVEGPWRADREDVVLPLREMGFAVEDVERPLEGPLGGDPASYVSLAARLGGTDVAVRRVGRREQRFLRGALGIGSADSSATATCGLCGREFPLSLLVAAHIKPRHLCSDDERLDMPHIGWPLCLFGCDALFEQGYVGVDETSRIVGLRDQELQAESLRNVIAPLVGTVASGWTPTRRRYFAAHRIHHA